jgi:hypothetical protein
VQIARANLAKKRSRLACDDISLELVDAASYEVPDDVTVAHLYCPFTGPVFAAAVQGLLDSLDRRPRRLALVYTVPYEHNFLLSTGRVRPIDSVPSRWPALRLEPHEVTVTYAVRPTEGDFPAAAELMRDARVRDSRWLAPTDVAVDLGARIGAPLVPVD